MSARKTTPLLLGVALGCAACAGRTSPEELPDVTPLHGERFSQDSAAEAAPSLQAPGRWWRRFEDPVSDELVQRALAGNLDLRAAAARVLEARSRTDMARGDRLPALDLSGSAARNFSILPGGNRFNLNDFRASATLSWQADLFGRLRATERARTAEWMASANDREALAHSLVAQTLRSRVALSVGAQRLALAQSIVASRASTLEIVEGRYSRGVAPTSAVDVRLARENLAAAEATVPEVHLGLEREGHALDELLGQKPGTSQVDSSLAQALPTSAPPPAGVPAQLLDRRPDLRAAALRATAAEAEVDLAVANLWPDLVLSATGGFRNSELPLFSSDNLFNALAGDLAVRVFGGGSLRAQVDGADARFEAQVADYAATLLGAVREVEDALASERRLREQLGFVRRQADEAAAAEELARDRYRRGLESLLTVLETERRRSSADDLALRLTQSVWNARIDLHLALGGDWELETETETETETPR